MKSAKLVAERLASTFLRGGAFSHAAAPMSRGVIELVLPAVQGQEDVSVASPDQIAGLAVHSVGYEVGVEQPKVHVYVIKGSRKAEKSVPESVDDVPVEVSRVGNLMVRPEMANSVSPQGHIFLRNGRVACGSSCAPSGEDYSGTLGALVRKTGDARLYVLSNNHVLAACNHVPVGMPILSPSNHDGRPGSRAPGQICLHSEIVELRSGEPPLVPPCREDVAIAEAPDPKCLTSWQGDYAAGYDTPSKVVKPSTGMVVKKVGRTTALTRGRVESRLLPFPMPYRSKFFTARVWFTEVWIVRPDGADPFALAGDSGSLVVAEDGSAAVGLVFAAAPTGDGVIIPLDHVVTLFGGLSLVRKHGV